MRAGKSFTTIFAVLAAIILCAGCSSGSGNSSPVLPSEDIQMPRVAMASEGHNLWGYYEIRIDPQTCEFEVLPAREALMHMNVLTWLENGPCTNCFQLVSLVPTLDQTYNATIKIKHPFPSPNLTGFDVRGIAIFEGSAEFWESGLNYSSFEYEDTQLLNPDGFTTLYNPTTIGHGMEGYVEGKLATYYQPSTTLNAFKNFISDDAANTRNAFYAGDEITVTYEIAISMYNPLAFGYAVDACWAPPVTKPVVNPMTDFGIDANCPEPWKIETFEEPVGDGLTEFGGWTVLHIDVFDRTGKDSYHDPIIECPYLFSGLKTANWSFNGDGFSRYDVSLTNETMMGPGFHDCLVRVEDNENESSPDWMDISAYTICKLRVTGPPVAEADADPNPQTEGKPIHFFDNESYDPDGGEIVLYEWDWESDGTYDETGPDAYHTWMTPGTYYVQLQVTDDEGMTGTLGLPLQISVVEEGIPVAPEDVTPDSLNFPARGVATDGNYCYIAADVSGLQIFDISNISNPTWVRRVEMPGSACDVKLYDHYAFVAGDQCGGVSIIDIENPPSAELVTTINLGTITHIDIDGTLLYTIGENLGVSILDISNPESPVPVKHWEFPGMFYFAVDIVVENGYAYLCGGSYGIWIVDVDPLANMHLVKEISSFMCWPYSVDVAGNYAYVADHNDGFQVIDIDPPEDAFIAATIPGNCWGFDLDVVGSRAYIASEYAGFVAVNISDPLNPFEEGAVDTPGTCGGADILDGYAYIADGYAGLTIINLNTGNITANKDTVGWSYDVDIYGGYAYVADGYGGISVVDVDPYEQAHQIPGMDACPYANSIDISGNYAYVTASGYGLQILDIDPPGTLTDVLTVPEIGDASDVEVVGDYAYVASENEGVYIIDINPPASANVVKFVEVTGAEWYDHRIAVSNGYAFLTREKYDITIIDVDPPSTASIVDTITTDKMAYGIEAADGYAYAGIYGEGLYIYDVDPIDSPTLITTVPYSCPDNLLVQNGYAYLCYGALSIVDIDPPESAYEISASPVWNANNIAVDGQYAYVAARGGGLRILSLW